MKKSEGFLKAVKALDDMDKAEASAASEKVVADAKKEATAEVLAEATDASKEATPAATSEAEELELDESDLEKVSTHKVPYKRFKEVNDELKRYRKELEAQKTQMDKEMRLLLAEEKLKLQEAYAGRYRTEEIETEYDPVKLELQALRKSQTDLAEELDRVRGEKRRVDLDKEIESARELYPYADDYAILGIKKSRPEMSIKDIAELLHNNVNSKIEAKYKELISKKKKNIEKTLTDDSAKVAPKDPQKPKTFKDAKAAAMAFLKGE